MGYAISDNSANDKNAISIYFLPTLLQKLLT